MSAFFAPVVASALVMAQAGEVKMVRVGFAEKANRHAVSGFGGEWDPHFWRAPNVSRGCDEKAWEKVLGRIREMGVSRVRMGILPDWYEPERVGADGAGYTWDTEPMRSLYRHLDACQAMGIRVTLTWWCAPTKRQSDGKPYWLACPGVKDWCSAPNDVEACADNVVAGLRYLVEARGYSCIDAFTFYNEPDWAFFDGSDKIDFERYAAVCRGIHKRMTDCGLRQRVALDLADASVHKGWLKECAEHLSDISDSFNVHSYVFACEDADYPRAIRSWIRQWVEQAGDKPLATNELGTRHYKGAYSVTDIETFERAFLVAQYAILGLNEGMSGALFWGLYDQHYYDGDPNDGSNGGMMKTNLMAYVNEDWRLRPTGQVWALVCHAARPGAKVFAGTSDDAEVDAVALAGKDVNVLAVNRAKEARRIALAELPGGAAGKAISTAKAFGREGVSTLDIPADSGTVQLPPESVAWLVLADGAEK